MDREDEWPDVRQTYDDSLSPDDREKGLRYRKLTYVFLICTWIGAAIFVILITKILSPLFTLPQSIEPLVGIGSLVCSVVSLGCYFVFSGKDTILRRYTLGRQDPRHFERLFDNTAVLWGKRRVTTGYCILAAFTCVAFAVCVLILILPRL